MTSDRNRYLANLSPPELLLYVAGGGKLVTRQMETRHAAALAALGLEVVPTAAALAELLKEGLPRDKPKPPTPMVFRPHQYERLKRRRPQRKRVAA